MVHLTRIYTRTGDAGQTRLADNSVASKTDVRVRAYGEVDEANSAIGLALAFGLPSDISDVLRRVQNELFDVGADISTPLRTDPPWPPLRIDQAAVTRLEAWCDEFGDPLPSLRSFILPGGSLPAAQLHVARTLVRRAERTGWEAVAAYGTEEATGADAMGGVHTVALTYLNRLSDLLFILARSVATQGGTELDAEVLWVPGGDRDQRRE